jgi:hypothetical protein
MAKFKKGSAEARRFMAKIRGMRKGKTIKRSSTSKRDERGANRQMVKRKRRASRRVGRVSRRGRRSKTKKDGLMGLIVGGAIYGVGRSYVATAVNPISSMLPLGSLNDNVTMGLLSYLLMKNTSGVLSNVGKAGLFVESSIASNELLTQGGINPIKSSSSSATIFS